MWSSERLQYQQLTKEDKSLSIELSMSEDIMRYITGKALNLEEAKDRFRKQLLTNAESPNLGFFKATKMDSLETIGYLKIVKWEDQIIEVGYAIIPQFSGQGFASEMTEAMIHHAEKHFPEVKQLVGTVQKENAASAHILSKFGFSVAKEVVKRNSTILHFIKEI
ncbi:GNAT family N-acetyltransferase [Jiulongibacter sp. NS-SX5]|uniref:GNAT family N-acetyltransferase n=1 Tax=Jiulongibacter sp. NS-SX5 TaxID=3463854 RepID=UPI004058E539